MRKTFIQIMIILIIVILFLGSDKAICQEEIIVFVKPFQAKGVPESFASNATEIFRSKLTGINQIRLVSEEKWREVMETNGIEIENITLFDRSADQKIGKFVRAEKLITGKIEKFGSLITMSVDWINLETGYVEATLAESFSDTEMLPEIINKIIYSLKKRLACSGTVKYIDGDEITIQIESTSHEWESGAIFDLQKNSGEVFGQVRLTRVSDDKAMGIVDNSIDKVKVGDLVVITKDVQADLTKQIKKNVGLVNFESDLTYQQKNDLYLFCQTQINKSNRFNLFDDQTVKDAFMGDAKVELDFIIDGEILKNRKDGTYTVTIRIKNFATDQIEYQDYEKCVENNLNATVEVLLFKIISFFPLRGKVTKIDQEDIYVNLGTYQDIKRKMEFVIKNKNNDNIIAEGSVNKVYSDYFTCRQNKKYEKVTLGSIVEMKEDEDLINDVKRSRAAIKVGYERYLADLYTSYNDSLENIQKKIKERTAKKSRIKISIGKIELDQEFYKNLFGGNRTGKFNTSIYLGNHPNFHILANYQFGYFEDNTTEPEIKNSFIAENSGGLGARIHFVLPFLFSTDLMPFVEGMGRYCEFKSKLKSGSKISVSENKWVAYYVTAEGGLEFVIKENFSLFAQAGINRLLKSPGGTYKFEYLFVDGGIAIWF